MKFLIVFVALFAYALARPNAADIVKSESDVGPEHWSWTAETSDGTAHHATGHLEKVAGHDGHDEAAVVHGFYEWVDDHTKEHFKVEYTADKDGFHPVGAHLPVA